MITVCILVPEYAVPASILDPRYMFTAVNSFLQQRGEAEQFEVYLVGIEPTVLLSDGAIAIRTDKTPQQIKHVELIIVPAIGGAIDKAIAANEDLLNWVTSMYKAGAKVASLCTGAFLLASTGLVNGRQCSTHWLFANQFSIMFPEVMLVDDKIVTEQNGLYSSGGANSYWNLLLYLVEKYTSREMAILAAKFFAIDMSRQTQANFIVFQGQKMHEDDTIKAAQEYMERHYNDKISVDDLAGMASIGRRSFERRFKKATRNTVMEYIQRVKVEAAKNNFEKGQMTISEVMYQVGYTDMKSFREVFKKVTGQSPLEYKNRYRQHSLQP